MAPQIFYNPLDGHDVDGARTLTNFHCSMKLHPQIFMITACMFAFCSAAFSDLSDAEDQALIHAREVLGSTILIDGHNDLPWTIREKGRDIENYDLRKNTGGDTDLAKLKAGLVGGQFWSVFIPTRVGEEGYAKVQLEQIDIARRMISRYPESLVLAFTADDIAVAASQGRIASMLGMEGGHAIENSLGALRSFYALGVRYMTLTHSKTLDWADSATDTPRHNGLTVFGREVVREMNRLGMLVDISHVSTKVMTDVLELSEAPVIFSHSSARALTNHPRNVPDHILSRMAANKGVVMVTFIPSFVSQEMSDWSNPLLEQILAGLSNEEVMKLKEEYAKENPPPKVTLGQVADHIDHVRTVAGVDNVGIGSDFWNGGDMPEGLEDTSGFPHLFAELIRRGWNDADLRKLAGENILRVLREAENVAARLKKTRPASTMLAE